MTDQQAREEELLSCYKRVARKIIVQAVKDFRYEVSQRHIRATEECEAFFRSSWFATLAAVAGYDKFISANERSLLIHRLRHSSSIASQLQRFSKAEKKGENI